MTNARIFLIWLTMHWLVGVGILVFDFAFRAAQDFVWPFFLGEGFFIGTAASTHWYFGYFCANTRWLEYLRENPVYGTVWEKKGPIL